MSEERKTQKNNTKKEQKIKERKRKGEKKTEEGKLVSKQASLHQQYIIHIQKKYI